MSFLGRIIRRSFGYAPSSVKYGTEPSFFMQPTRAGKDISPETALELGTVYACIRLIAQTIAQLQPRIYQQRNGILQETEGTTLGNLLQRSPDNDVTPFDFLETLVANALLYGKSYALIERNNADEPVRLLLLDPAGQRVEIQNGTRLVHFRGHNRGYYPDELLCFSTLYGKSPIEMNRDALGLARAAQDFAADFFGSNGAAMGILTSEQPLKPEQIAAVRNSWQGSQGLGIRVLPFLFKFQKLNITPDEGQMMQTRKLSQENIAQLFGVPTGLLSMDSNVTYSNQENQAIQFVRNTISPLVRRFEQEIELKLTSRPEIRVRFDLSDLLRGDTAARTAFYHQAVTDGILSINEIRAREGLNPIEGGDSHLVGLNQISLDRLSDYSEKVSSQDGNPNL